jgi:iron(III) transport system permease protein
VLPSLTQLTTQRFWSERSQFVLPTLVTAFTVLLVLLPLLTMIVFSLREGNPWLPGGFTWDNYDSAYTTKHTYTILWDTAWLALASTLISVAVAALFAFLTERTDLPYRHVARALMLIPMAMPGILFAVSWTLLLSPRIGVFNVWLRDFINLFGFDLTEGPFNIYSMSGMVFLEGMRGVTTTFLILVGAFRAMDPNLEEAARAAGGSPITTFRRVTIPLLTPALLAAGIYSFMTHLESLEIPIIIGLPAKVFVFPTYIYFSTQRTTPPNYGLAAALAVTFIVISVFLIWWYRRVIGQSNRFATITGKGYRPRIIKLGKWRYLFFSIFALYFLLTIGAPALTMLWNSFMPIPMAPSMKLFDSLTLNNYSRLMTTRGIWPAFGNTIIVALATATVTMVLSLTLAWVVVRMKSRWSAVLDTLAFLPHALPGVVIGISLIYLTFTPPFNTMGLYGGLGLIIIGLTISFLSFGSRTMNSALTQIHSEMEEAAKTSGVRWRIIMQRIVLPLLLPAFISGWIWVANHALRNLSIPLLLSSRDNKVISVVLFHSWDDGYPGLTCAIGVVLMAGLALFTLGGRWVVTKVSKQQNT